MRPLVLATVLTVLSTPAAALAISCGPFLGIPGMTGETTILPADGFDDVPTDALVWVIARPGPRTWECPEAPAVRLTDADGLEVALTEELSICGSVGRVVALRPEELRSGETYTLARADEAAEWRGAAFVVGDFTDDEPPPVPELLSRTLHADTESVAPGPCAQELDDSAAWSIFSEGDLNLLLRDGGDEPGDPDGLVEGDLADATPFSTLELSGRIQPATRLDVRLGAFDLSGNFSGWSAPDVSHMPAAGCTTRQRFDEASLALLLLLSGGLLARRRL